jgi:CopA family copper-resistance protein
VTPDEGWIGLFKRGEKVRLRFINGSAMTIFDVRIPGLKMTVVAADGQNIEPVTIDEFRIGVAETYDVLVEPSDDSAYTVFAQSIDRTGFTCGTLTPDIGMTASIPNMDIAPTLGHRDMGMGMASMPETSETSAVDHSQHQMSTAKTISDKKTDHKSHDSLPEVLGKAGFGSTREITHVSTEAGPQVDMRAISPQSGLTDPGIGLRNHLQKYGRKVLTYADIKNLYPTSDPREPTREIELHLTGNMSRYMWSINGVKFADADPIQLRYGERVRITLVNDTMMSHPMHLHGMWSELETGEPSHIPRKHTVIVQPGSKISYLVTADARGQWAYHCHLIFHMAGMFRQVTVS